MKKGFGRRWMTWMLCAGLVLTMGGCGATGETVQSDSAPLVEVEYKKNDLKWEWDEDELVRVSLSGERAEVDGAGVQMNGNVLCITEEGDYLLTGELNGRILVDAGKNDKVRLILAGVTVNSTDSAAIFALKADKLTLTLAEGTQNVVLSGKNLITEDDEELDAAIYSKTDLVINGEGSLSVDSPSGHGILSKDDLRIISGNITVQAGNDGIRGRDALLMYGGTVNVVAADDGVKSNNDEDEEKGYVSIDGGELTVSSGDDGIKAETKLQIRGGTVNVTKSYEAVEAQYILISGGTISLTASDDGINAAGGEAESTGGWGRGPMMGDLHQSLKFTGGVVYVDASGDGIDSNGTIEFAGGEVYVSGPVSNGNGALDSDSSMTLTGGIVLATGSAGMASAPSSDTQPVTMITATTYQKGGKTVSIRKTTGEELAAFTPSKDWSSLVVSVPGLEQNESFDVYVGGEKMTTATAGSGGRGFGGGFGGMGGSFGGQSPQGGRR